MLLYFNTYKYQNKSNNLLAHIYIFRFWSDIFVGYVSLQNCISTEPLSKDDILSWQVIYPQISLKKQINNFIALPQPGKTILK
jgi:hypothetical protein